METTPEVSRTVRSGVRDGRETKTVLARRTYATGIDDLWNALTDAERLPRWFLPVSGELRVGGRFQFEGQAGGEVLACEPPTRAEVTWEYGGGVSWLTVRLTPEVDGTALELEHVAPLDPMWDEFGPGAVGVGWDLASLGLERHVDTGEAVDPAAFEAWSGGEDGRAFVVASSAGWAAAAIADGADPESARAGERATTAFYTGTGG